MKKFRISKEEALSFLLTYIVVEQSTEVTLNQRVLFDLSRMAEDAANRVNQEDGIIPHEIIESIAMKYLERV
ncbi:MAG: hypothetical protein O2780_01120 [Proteobacteria bacterium]|jgi:hypothetical protein|nr:hypothetical protein [Pseudomonadota bacterium]MDA1300381.1 hypothetical protein [Pseudomonadota bacterium]